MSEPIIRHVAIRGRVQGVGFRFWVEENAGLHDLEGWVRNRRDGSVEAVFAGPASAVARMIEVCRRGPPGSRVEAADVSEVGPEILSERHQAERFSVLPTR
jgi:acylphosphatase